jgi:3-oxoadipate enol-lactonase
MLVYQDIGKGTPLVMIHGLGSKKEAWEPQHGLADHYRLILPDLRGHGETKLAQDLSVKNFALDIIHLLDLLEIPSAYICGLSLGGIVAQEIYRQHPERVKGLILANTTSYIPALLTYSSICHSHHLLHYDKHRLLNLIVETSLYDHSYKEEAMDTFQLRDTYSSCAMAPVGINYYPVLPTINKPVLLIGSTHDRITPLINILSMSYFIQDVQSVYFNHTGHLSNIERKEPFNQAISDFLKKVS